MAAFPQIIIVDFNDLGGDNSRMLITPNPSDNMFKLKQFIKQTYPKYAKGQLSFYLMFGHNNVELTDDKTVEHLLSYYRNDIPLFGFSYQADKIISTGNHMSTGLTSGDLYWAQVAAKNGDGVNRYVNEKKRVSEFHGTIYIPYTDLENLKPQFTQMGNKMKRQFPSKNNFNNTLIMLNAAINFYQNNIIPTVYIIGSPKTPAEPGSFDYIKGRGGWLMEYRAYSNAIGVLYFFDMLNRNWQMYHNGQHTIISAPPRPSGVYVAIADEDDAIVRNVIDMLYS